ncbi:MAG: extradiol ring-cleavage dioxygenase, partial [Chloroflexi bacterium]|nr:extradiol ring-cleavage dioxygenase [Chloroflexota bacterium]
MGEILGVGTTHYPPLITPDEDRGFPLTNTLAHNDKVPEEMKNPTSWPEPMRIEYGEDEGLKAAGQHRERLLKGFRKIRTAIDDFKPDLVLIWGDDQYENFKEDIIPPFCVLAYDEFEATPYTNRDGSFRRNVWDEAQDKKFVYQGAPQAGRALPTGLTNEGF